VDSPFAPSTATQTIQTSDSGRKIICKNLSANEAETQFRQFIDFALREPGLYCRDRGDDKFIETALKAKAHGLVTGDKDLLEAAPLASLPIISPQQALAFLGI